MKKKKKIHKCNNIILDQFVLFCNRISLFDSFKKHTGTIHKTSNNEALKCARKVV